MLTDLIVDETKKHKALPALLNCPAQSSF